MATVVPVHGTFAHAGRTQNSPSEGGLDPQWWENGSTFQAELNALVEGQDGAVRFEPFVWDGENSEQSRRAAAAHLLQKASGLEAQGEPYVLVGHSHGGSVISSTLLEAAWRRKKLTGMKRWVSVGTPFIRLRKEMFLFSRIPLMLQAVYVALLLFVVMFVLPMALGLLAGNETRNRYMGDFAMAEVDSLDGIATLALTTLTISSVFILFYLFLVVMDWRMLHMHSRSNQARAKQSYGPAWLGLTHDDDEVVQGLRSLGTAKFSIFDKSFFVPIFTAMAVFALPVAYLVLLFSPPAMIAITEYLKTNVYQYQASKPLVDEAKKIRDEIRAVRKDMRGSGMSGRECFAAKQPAPNAGKLSAQQVEAACVRWKAAQERYRELRNNQPDLPRTLRFEAAYLDPDTGQLQGNGRDMRVNSWMLFNVANESITRAFGLDSVRGSAGRRGNRSNIQMRRIAQLLVPALVVPLLFAVSAVGVLLLVRRFGGLISGHIAAAFDAITWSQIRRSVLGNDTTTEIARDATERPGWLSESYPYLPQDLASKISDQSNAVAAQSLGKFRGAISTLAFADGANSGTESMAQYFTWKELVHSSYFDVPTFRKLVAYAISQSDGFRPSEAFRADPEFSTVAAWFDELTRMAATPAPAVQDAGQARAGGA